jgi:hypothetical protein
VLADDVGVCAIKTGGGGTLLGSLVGMDVWGELHLFGTNPAGQQLPVVTTNLGEGDERKNEG